MPHPVPYSLRSLLDARSASDGHPAWTGFLEEYSPLLLRVARSVSRDHDGAMDQYVFVLDALRRDESQRLRAWTPEGHGRFETWLVVVARRLCFDFQRQRYGRKQQDSSEADARHAERRNLTDLVGNELGLAAIASPSEDAPDIRLQRADLGGVLNAALAQLDTADRLLLKLRFEDELSVPEIARLWARPSPFVVYRRLDRVLADLRRSLVAAGIVEPSA